MIERKEEEKIKRKRREGTTQSDREGKWKETL